MDGCPPGLKMSENQIQKQLERRRPGASGVASSRKEKDKLIMLSGILDGKTTGGPLAAIVKNTDVRSEAYEMFKVVPRPGHADYTASVKYDGFHDHRGGGMFSGRMTIPLVISGSVAMQALSSRGINVAAHSLRIGRVWAKSSPPIPNIERVARKNDVACADPSIAKLMRTEILDAKRDKDSVGGIVECIVSGMPVGVGEPFFDSVESVISHLLFSVPAINRWEMKIGRAHV